MLVVGDELVIGKVAGAVGQVVGDKVQVVPIGDEVDSVVFAVLLVLGVCLNEAMVQAGRFKNKI